MSRADAWITGGAGVVIVAACAAIAAAGNLVDRIPLFLLLAAVAFGAYLAACVRLLRQTRPSSARLLAWLFAVDA